jgi:hypothetical protein
MEIERFYPIKLVIHSMLFQLDICPILTRLHKALGNVRRN